MAIMESIAAASSVLNFIGGQQRNDAAAAQAQSAQNFSAEQFATRYQITVKDMEAAGLSPMLAYSQGGGTPPTGVAAPMQNSFQDAPAAASAINQAHVQQASVDNIKADTALKEAQANAAAVQARSSAFSAISSQQLQEKQGQEITGRLESGLYDSQVASNTGSANQANANANLIGNKATELGRQLELGAPDKYVQLLEAQYKEAMARTGSAVAASAQLYQSVKESIKRTDLLKLDYDAASKFDNIGREAGQFRPLIDMIVNVLRHSNH